MFESIYVGLSGLAGFSRNLTVIGNNVSNLNSPGFKASQLHFADLMYASTAAGGGALHLGSGVDTGATRVLFTQGAMRETGSATDLAIDGNGLFVLRSEAGTTYTRAGSFEFDAAGFLISRANGARVGALGEGGGLQDIGVGGLRATPGQATSVVRLIDNLSSGDTAHELAITVFDAAGASRNLTLALTNNGAAVPRSWLLEVRDAAGNALSSGEIRFGGDGSPAEGFNSHAFTLASPGGEATGIVLQFGDPGSFSGATNFSAGPESTLALGSQDGFAAGSLTEVSFDADGVLVAAYSNGRTSRGPRVALAFFESPQELEAAGAGVFENRGGQRVTLGSPRSGPFGAIAGGALESANVDLAQQFSELIVTQRGYQASSQVITAANEMIQQLFDIKARR
jgi:flagellar hook protein FlgE